MFLLFYKNDLLLTNEAILSHYYFSCIYSYKNDMHGSLSKDYQLIDLRQFVVTLNTMLQKHTFSSDVVHCRSSKVNAR